MLATCVVEGWTLAGYAQPDHPGQRAVTGELGSALSLDLAEAAWGVDGCGLPTYGVPLAALARAFAAAASDPAFQRCQNAMARHPFLVAGTARLDTAIMATAGQSVTAKIGAAGVWAAAVRPDGPGVAIKLEAGAGDALAPVAIAVLQRLGVLGSDLPEALGVFARPPVHNWAGTVVGETRVEAAELAAL
jgi:L-asparaginase II